MLGSVCCKSSPVRLNVGVPAAKIPPSPGADIVLSLVAACRGTDGGCPILVPPTDAVEGTTSPPTDGALRSS